MPPSCGQTAPCLRGIPRSGGTPSWRNRGRYINRCWLVRPRARSRWISAIDGAGRTVSYRKLPDFPVFVLAGLATSAIRDQWLSQMRSQLLFGLPATAALIFIVALALRRTRRLHAETAGRQAAEDALKQAQRLEALGQLTGGVAHDFNNLLMVIGGSVERLKSRIGDPQSGRSLSMIEAAVHKGASLTKQLLSFSRRQSLSPRVWDVVACVGDFREVLRQSLRGDIQIAFDLPAGPLPVRVDRNELEIALLNLVLNARDAMPDGGTIRIGVAGTDLKRDADANGLDGEFVSITVSDTGQGIAEEIRDQGLRALFHDEENGQGHRAGSEPGLRVYPAIGRRDLVRNAARGWDRLYDAASALPRASP